MDNKLKDTLIKVAKQRRHATIIKLAQDYGINPETLQGMQGQIVGSNGLWDMGKNLLFGQPAQDSQAYGGGYFPGLAARYSEGGGHPGVTPYTTPAWQKMRQQDSIWGKHVLPWLGGLAGLKIKGGRPAGMDWHTAEKSLSQELDLEHLRQSLDRGNRRLLRSVVDKSLPPDMANRAARLNDITGGVNFALPFLGMAGSQYGQSTTQLPTTFSQMPK